MTTITISQNIGLRKFDFVDISEFLEHLLNYSTGNFEFEEFSEKEQNLLNQRSNNMRNLETDIVNLINK